MGHVKEYPTMHYFGIPIHTPSMTVLLNNSRNSSPKLHYGNVDNMPFYHQLQLSQMIAVKSNDIVQGSSLMVWNYATLHCI